VKYRHGKVDTMLWVSLVIITVFGGATLILHDENFIKWKPSILYWFFASALLFSKIVLDKNILRNLLQDKMQLPDSVWNTLNLSWSGFFIALGFLNLYVAFNYSTDAWVNFKLFGTTGLMLIFILAQAFLLAKHTPENK
jgi:intracellular septation protein